MTQCCNCWIVTLDVLKCLGVTDRNTHTICWIVTLDVLKCLGVTDRNTHTI